MANEKIFEGAIKGGHLSEEELDLLEYSRDTSKEPLKSIVQEIEWDMVSSSIFTSDHG